MCKRCDEFKLALDHAVVVALKFARLTTNEIVVGFHGDALVVMPNCGIPLQSVVAVVRATSTADELKSQVAKYLAALKTPPIEVVDMSGLMSDLPVGCN